MVSADFHPSIKELKPPCFVSKDFTCCTSTCNSYELSLRQLCAWTISVAIFLLFPCAINAWCYNFCLTLRYPAVMRKHGKLMSFLRTFFSHRPPRNQLKQSGIVKERVFGCDLGEHLLNSGHDGNYSGPRIN